MSLILDHKNGINTDNRIENLRIVCPNCNSTLETHCKGAKRKNKKERKKHFKCVGCNKDIDKSETGLCIDCYNIKQRKVIRPEISLLIEEIDKSTYKEIGRKYGVSDNCIKKWIRRSGIEPPKKRKTNDFVAQLGRAPVF